MQRTPIDVAEDFHHPIPGAPGLTAAERIAVLYGPFDVPKISTKQAVAYASVNHGRWSVRCPWCSSSQNASREDRRFFCVECGNAAVSGAWVAVEWPPDWQDIETALSCRPDRATRNWVPGETAADVFAENVKHGVM